MPDNKSLCQHDILSKYIITLKFNFKTLTNKSNFKLCFKNKLKVSLGPTLNPFLDVWLGVNKFLYLRVVCQVDIEPNRNDIK